MTGWRDVSIRTKLMVTVAAASGIGLLLASIAFMAYDRASFREGMVRQLAGEAEIVGFNSATAIVFRDPRSAATTLFALQSETHVRSAALYLGNGRLFVKYERPGASDLAPPPATLADRKAPRGHAFEPNQLVLTQPVSFESERVGTLVIRAELSELGLRFKRYALIVALVSLVALGVASLIGWRAQRGISQPLLRLAETSRQISEQNDFSVRAFAPGRDELGTLVAAFNHMLARLAARDEELRRAQAELLQRVEERTDLHRKAEAANKLKEEFLATLSHELRTPLNAIVGWAHMLRSGLDAPTAARAVEAISRNAMVQSQLIADILDMQRIASGKLRLNLTSVSLGTVIEAAIDTVRPAATAKAIDIQTLLEPDVGPVLGDPDRLQQIVWNLLANGVKFTPQGGCVRVLLARADAHVELIVEDNGPGLAPEFIPYAFDRFRQADSSSTRRHGGLGLGLAIVRNLSELHGGSVSAANRTDGSGARFTVRLPRLSLSPIGALPARQLRHSASDREVWLDEAPRLDGVRVLIVDDELDARELLAAALSQCGADVATASSAAQALASLREKRPDVLLSDIEMPGEDGYALLRQVRALAAEEGGRIPAAALTAYAGTEDRMRALAAGFQMHVPKPVQPAELAAVVASLAASGRA